MYTVIKEIMHGSIYTQYLITDNSNTLLLAVGPLFLDKMTAKKCGYMYMCLDI